MEHVPEPHQGATVDRRRTGPVIPAVRDTTTIDHSHLQATEDFRETDGGESGSVGVPAHAGPAVTPEGRPPGPFAVDAGHGEGPEDDGLRRAREPAAARPDTRVVSVRGREGDLRDLLSGADLHGDAFPIRAGRPAKRRVPGPDGAAECLRDHVAAPHAPAVTDLTVPASGGAGPVGSAPPCWTGTAGAGRWRPGSGRRVGDADRGRRIPASRDPGRARRSAARGFDGTVGGGNIW